MEAETPDVLLSRLGTERLGRELDNTTGTKLTYF